MRSASFLPLRSGLLVAIVAAAAYLSSRPGPQWLAIGVAIAAATVLAVLQVRLGHQADRYRGISHELRRLNETLEAQVESRTADLLDANARLQSIIDSAVDAIIVIDARGLIQAFNPAAERLFGYAEREVTGQNVNILMPSPYHEEHDGYLSRYLATGEAKIIGLGRQVTGLSRDGTTFPLHLSVGELTVGGERWFTGILHDLSARVRIEQQLRERAALAWVGEMAAVIAHEVKNPLAGIRGAVQVIGSRLPANSADASITTEIVTRIDALDRLMKDLLLFARPPQPRRAPVKVVPLVTMTAALLGQDPSLQELNVEVAGSSPDVLADAEMLKIVVQNLLLNGAHAMRGRGTIKVAVQAVDSTCRIAITDSGPGIPPEIRDKIFTAFFTTKTRGSGLGLATTKRLIEAHHGNIQVECPPDGGTTVTVSLPTQPDDRTPAPAA